MREVGEADAKRPLEGTKASISLYFARNVKRQRGRDEQPYRRVDLLQKDAHVSGVSFIRKPLPWWEMSFCYVFLGCRPCCEELVSLPRPVRPRHVVPHQKEGMTVQRPNSTRGSHQTGVRREALFASISMSVVQ